MKEKAYRLILRSLCACLVCLLLSGAFYGCGKKADPFATNEISSISIDKKQRVCIQASLNALALEEHAGSSLLLYELQNGESIGAISSLEPLDEQKLSAEVTFRVPLMDGERSRLYSSFAIVFSDDGSALCKPSYIENPEALAKASTPFRWQASPKSLTFDNVEAALELGAIHAAVELPFSALLPNDDEVISEECLAALEGKLERAFEAGMQVTLRLLPDKPVSKSLAVTLFDLLATHCADKTSAVWVGAFSASISAEDAAYFCRILHLAFASDASGIRLYIEAPKMGSVETKAYFSDLMTALDEGGTIEWGAALAPSTEDGMMSPYDLSEVGAFVLASATAGHASRVAVALPSFDASDEELQAVKLAYSYRLALSAGAGLILYSDHYDDNSGLCGEMGEPRLAAEVFSTIDTGLSEEIDALCASFFGSAWSELKTPSQISRRLLWGISNLGTDGLARKPLFDFSGGDTLGFVGINTMDPPITRGSAAWSEQVLYTWLDPQLGRAGGVRCVLDNASQLVGATSMTIHLLSQAQDTETCTAELKIEGQSAEGVRLCYRSDVSLSNGEWQTVTFQIGGLTADLDTSRPCVVSLTIRPDSDTQEPYVLWVKDFDIRTPEKSLSHGSQLLLIFAAAAVTFAILFVSYLILSRKRRQ